MENKIKESTYMSWLNEPRIFENIVSKGPYLQQYLTYQKTGRSILTYQVLKVVVFRAVRCRICDTNLWWAFTGDWLSYKCAKCFPRPIKATEVNLKNAEFIKTLRTALVIYKTEKSLGLCRHIDDFVVN